MRKLKDYGLTGPALLDAEEAAAPADPSAFRRPLSDPLRPRRELVDDFADDADTEAFLRANGRNRRIRRGLIPNTRNGWIAAGVGLLVTALALGAAAVAVSRYLGTAERFRIQSSSAIEIDGNSHITRAQMLSIFGGDVERNIFHVSLDERRAALEQMPWVEHATVMRLLPNRIRIHVVERVPVAFARQGADIGLVDANGVLLDIPLDAPGNPSYTFPVVTGLRADETPASRAQRMKLYAALLKDLDADGKGASAQLSEIDLSDPEDVKALIPDHNVEVLVHFGTDRFLARYRKFSDHINEWRTQYPRLSSVDMRYERQVVLQMPPAEAAAAVTPPIAATTAAVPSARDAKPNAVKVVPSAVAKTVAKPAPAPLNAPQPLKSPAASPPTSTTVVQHSAPPARTSSAAAHSAVATHSARGATSTRDLATRKRVEAIKAWMAKREKARKAAAAQ